jgi:hypothetical protein
MVRAMSAVPVVQFLEETLAGELLRDHEVRLQATTTVRARELLKLRFGDNVEHACEAFTRGALRVQVANASIESLDAHVDLVPGLAVKLIQLADPEPAEAAQNS